MEKIGIIGAMNIEVEFIKNNITLIEEKEYASFKFYIGKFENIDVVVTTCGVGKVNAACCTQILIDKFNVLKIINTGIAGSLKKDVKICDIVISDNVTHHDVRKDQMIGLFPFKEFFSADKKLIQIAIKAYRMMNIHKNTFHVGRIVSGESFVSDTNLKKIIVDNYNPCCVEMEGSAIGHVAEINEIPFIIIRSISDNADEEATDTYDNFAIDSANKSANLILNILRILNNREKYL